MDNVNIFNGEDHVLVREMIQRVQLLSSLNKNRCILLLIQYGWDEELLNADLTAKRNIAAALQHAVDPIDDPVTVNDTCETCGHYNKLVMSDCGHLTCQNCLTLFVQRSLVEGRPLIKCLSCDEKFLNPSFILSLVNPATSLAYQTKLEEGFRLGQNSFLKILWKYKIWIGVVGAVGVASVYVVPFALDLKSSIDELKKHMGKYPRFAAFLMKGKTMVDQGIDPLKPGNMWELVKSSKEDIWSYCVEKVKGKNLEA